MQVFALFQSAYVQLRTLQVDKMPYSSRTPSKSHYTNSHHSDHDDDYTSVNDDDDTWVEDDGQTWDANDGPHQHAPSRYRPETYGSYPMTQRGRETDQDGRLRDREGYWEEEEAEKAMPIREAARTREPPRRRAEQARQTSYSTARRRYVNEGGPGKFLGEDPPDETSDRYPIASGSRHDPGQREKYIRELGPGDDYPVR